MALPREAPFGGQKDVTGKYPVWLVGTLTLSVVMKIKHRVRLRVEMAFHVGGPGRTPLIR